MLEEDEEDLELLRQYEEKEGIHSAESEGELDSETEERLLSSVYYRIGNDKNERKDDSSDEDDESDESSIDANTEYKESDSMDDDEEISSEEDALCELIERKGEELRAKRLLNYRGPVCQLCSKVGHSAGSCSICPTCLSRHGRYIDCGLDVACTRCKERGHVAMDCTNPRIHTPCPKCNEPSHAENFCPAIFHAYLYNENHGQPIMNPLQRACYNCGYSDHYGDECTSRGFYYSKKNDVMTVFSRHSFRPKGRYFKDTSSSRNTSSRSSSSPYQKEPRRGPTNIQWSLNRSSSSSSSRNNHSTSSSSYRQPSSTSEVTGKNNWKAIPKPSRSGTVNVSNASQRAESLNFPRGQQQQCLPQPSSSGVINIADVGTRGPRFRGGYSRR